MVNVTSCKLRECATIYTCEYNRSMYMHRVVHMGIHFANYGKFMPFSHLHLGRYIHVSIRQMLQSMPNQKFMPENLSIVGDLVSNKIPGIYFRPKMCVIYFHVKDSMNLFSYPKCLTYLNS